MSEGKTVKTMNSIKDVNTGDVFTLVGTPWTVIGFIDRPAALLERVGCEETPTNHRTHHTVIFGTDHARQFKFASGPSADADNVGNTDAIGTDDWIPDERTVRHCIEALPDELNFTDEWMAVMNVARAALEALLPKADPAMALVKEYGLQKLACMNSIDAASAFARHLIKTGKIVP